MSAHVHWFPEGRSLVRCQVFTDMPPVLSASDDGKSYLMIGDSSAGEVSAGHAEFARELTEAARVYAQECVRWARRGEVGVAGVVSGDSVV